MKQEPTRKRSVSVKLFRKFLGYPTTEANGRYRDYFLLMFYLIGINSIDLLLARMNCLVNGRFEYIRSKTHKKYSIKVEPEAEELLKRYAGKDYLLEAMDHCKLYRSFAHEMNDALKEIGDVRWEMVPDPDDLFAPPKLTKTITPVIPEISTYYARHCWATFAHEAGVSLQRAATVLAGGATFFFAMGWGQMPEATSRMHTSPRFFEIPPAPSPGEKLFRRQDRGISPFFRNRPGMLYTRPVYHFCSEPQIDAKGFLADLCGDDLSVEYT